MKRIGVLGTFVWDEIWHPALGDAQPLRQWGGLTYSLSAFAAACPDGAEVCPLARLGSDLASSALALVSRLPNVTVGGGLLVVDEPNNRVELRYRDRAERLERLTGGVAEWSIDELLPLTRDLDALYLNFLAGNELALESAKAVRAAVSIPIYADLHSLFLGPPGDGPREPRRLEDWEEWLACFDYVQMNETELGLLGVERVDAFSLLPHLVQLGPTTVIVTRGPSGAVAATTAANRRRGLGNDGSTVVSANPWRRPRPARGEPELLELPLSAPVQGDPTGCGDVWGSVLFCGLLEGRSLEEAAARAHRAAAAKMRTSRVDLVQSSVAAALGRSSAPI